MRNLFSIILLMAVSLFSACKKDKTEYENIFDKSYQKWQTFKKSSDNSYKYVVESASWTGTSSTTTITVREGKVVSRGYVGRGYESNTSDVIVIREEWTEDEQTLNTHENAWNTWTLDQVYEEAKNNWLQKRSNTKLYIRIENDGMISKCGYSEDGCVDDCFIGITIKSITEI